MKQANTISQEEYKRLKAKDKRYNSAMKRLYPKWNGGVIPQDKRLPERITNEQSSNMEVYEWVHNPPDKYFLYIDEKKWKATTWTGEELGNVGFGSEFRDNFGGKRQSIKVYGNNGVNYSGTYFKSSGDYARVKALKGKQAEYYEE